MQGSLLLNADRHLDTHLIEGLHVDPVEAGTPHGHEAHPVAVQHLPHLQGAPAPTDFIMAKVYPSLHALRWQLDSLNTVVVARSFLSSWSLDLTSDERWAFCNAGRNPEAVVKKREPEMVSGSGKSALTQQPES